MKSLSTLLCKQRILVGSIIALFIILLISLPNRALQSDENWFGEQAYWLLHEGTVKLKSIPLIFNWDQEMLVHHKLLTWSGVVLIKTFGWSVYPLRIFVFFLALMTFYFMYKLSDKDYTFLSKKHLLISFILLLTTPELIIRIFFFRPEVLVMCFAFMSFYFLYKFYAKGSLKLAGISGLFAGIAFVSHLTAVIFPVAGFLVLLFAKKWKGMLVYGLIGFLTCLVYTENLWSYENIQQYIYELKNWPSHSFEEKVEGGGIVQTIWNNIKGLLDEHKRYFWDQDIWLISGMFFLSLIVHFKYIRQKEPLLLKYTIITLILMGLVNGSHGPRYLVYVFPYMTLIISLVVYKIFKDREKIKQIAFMVILIGQLGILSLAYHKIFSNKVDHVAKSNQMLASIPRNSHVIGPWNLIYNNINNYHLYNFKSYEYIEEKRAPYTQLELLKNLHERRIDYIVLEESIKNNDVYHWFRNWEIEKNSYYDITKQEDGYLILKRLID